MGGLVEKLCHFVALSCKLRLFRFSARLKFQDGPSVVISNFDMKISPFWFSGPLLNFHDVGYPIIDSKLSQGIVEFQSFVNPSSSSKFKGHMYSKVQKFTIW